LLHVIDAANPAWEQQVEAVQKLLRELELGDLPVLSVYNKVDLLPADQAAALAGARDGVALSARDPASFGSLLSEMERRFWPAGEAWSFLPSREEAPLPKDTLETQTSSGENPE